MDRASLEAIKAHMELVGQREAHRNEFATLQQQLTNL